MISLSELADKIPTLGFGGNTIKDSLVELVSEVQDNTAIIDIGPWLGSTTAYLSVGIHKYKKKNIEIHCYDKWLIDNAYITKMKKYRMDLKKDSDALPLFMRNLVPFNTTIIPHKRDLKAIKSYDGPRISLLIDDICNGKKMTDKMFELFLPSLIPGSMVVMMDYFHFQLPPEKYRDPLYSYQKRVMEMNEDVFTPVGRLKGYTERVKSVPTSTTMTMVFKYNGGTPKLCAE